MGMTFQCGKGSHQGLLFLAAGRVDGLVHALGQPGRFDLPGNNVEPIMRLWVVVVSPVYL